MGDRQHLPTLVAIDVVAAGGAAFLVAPFITIVDRGIIENASGRQKLKASLINGFTELCTRPWRLVGRREFAWIWGLYSATYVTANSTDTACEWVEMDNSIPKFITTTAVNMPFCITKDRAFARMFGVIAPTAMPMSSFGLFAIRDSMTIAASFSLPRHVSQGMQDHGSVSSNKADVAAQLACPMAIQLLSTPLHLLGLDLYNNKNSPTQARLAFVSREYWKSCFARFARIGPAFGVGGVGNAYFRNTLRAEFAPREGQTSQ